MHKLLALSLLHTATVACAQEPTPIFDDTPSINETVQPAATPTNETESPETADAEAEAWKPKLLIRLEMTADDQLPSILSGTATGATANFASVYCDNISVSITSADDGQSQYTLKTECKAHVRVVGLQIDCEALEITDGQLNLTKVQMVQQGQTISTDKLSMTLPVFGVTTTKFAKSLDALDATPELTNPFRGRDDRNSNWNRQAKPFTGTGFGDDLSDDWALKPGVRAFQPARPQMSSGR